MGYIAARLREPSSLGGIGLVATNLVPALAGDKVAIGAVVAGLLSVLVPESKAPAAAPQA